MNQEFLTKKSPGILAMYWSVLIFLAVMLVGVPIWSQDDMSSMEITVFRAAFSIITIFFMVVLYRIYHMHYAVKNGEIIIHGAFNKNVVKISDIDEIKRSPVRMGIRLWGGSFVGGRYYLPGIGKAWVAITNFEDGVLLTTRDKEHYLITPQNPDQFIEIINKSK